jgi:hypothetical protein
VQPIHGGIQLAGTGVITIAVRRSPGSLSLPLRVTAETPVLRFRSRDARKTPNLWLCFTGWTLAWQPALCVACCPSVGLCL